MEGIPCWLLALSDASLFQFTEDLIAQYPQKYDDLKKSLENMQKF